MSSTENSNAAAREVDFQLTDELFAALHEAVTDDDVIEMLRLTPLDLPARGGDAEPYVVRLELALRRTQPRAMSLWDVFQALGLWDHREAQPCVETLFSTALGRLDAGLPPLADDAPLDALCWTLGGAHTLDPVGRDWLRDHLENAKVGQTLRERLLRALAREPASVTPTRPTGPPIFSGRGPRTPRTATRPKDAVAARRGRIQPGPPAETGATVVGRSPDEVVSAWMAGNAAVLRATVTALPFGNTMLAAVPEWALAEPLRAHDEPMREGVQPILEAVSPEEAYNLWSRDVWRFLARLGVPSLHLEDATQDVFIAVYRRWDDYAGLSTRRTWVLGFAPRAASVYRRRSAGRRALPPTEADRQRDPAEDPFEATARREATRIIQNFIGGLRETERVLFVLVDLEGASVTDAAQILGIATRRAYKLLEGVRRNLDATLLRLRKRER